MYTEYTAEQIDIMLCYAWPGKKKVHITPFIGITQSREKQTENLTCHFQFLPLAGSALSLDGQEALVGPRVRHPSRFDRVVIGV